MVLSIICLQVYMPGIVVHCPCPLTLSVQFKIYLFPKIFKFLKDCDLKRKFPSQKKIVWHITNVPVLLCINYQFQVLYNIKKYLWLKCHSYFLTLLFLFSFFFYIAHLWPTSYLILNPTLLSFKPQSMFFLKLLFWHPREGRFNQIYHDVIGLRQLLLWWSFYFFGHFVVW